MTLLRIMLVAARPLTLDEANVALTLADQAQEPKSYADVEADLWPRDNFQSIVTNLCGLFVSVYDSKLSFIHQTAREFLLDSLQEGNWKGHFNMPQSHSEISRTCLFHLLLPDISRPLESDSGQDEQYPYLSYVASFWPLHFVSQEVTNANAFRNHARMLCHVAGYQVSIWAPGYFEHRYVSWKNWTDLTLASYLGLDEVVQDILLKEVADVDAADEDGRTPLHWAVENGHVEVVKLLLEKGPDVDAVDRYERMPVYLAAANGHVEVVKLLLEKGADIDAVNRYGRILLRWAARIGHVEVVKLLLEKGADIDAATEDGRTPLYSAAKNGHVEVVKLLLEKGADIDATNRYGRTPLHWAARIGHVEVVKLVLEKGADIDAVDRYGRTPLHWAAENGHIEVIKLLSNTGS